MNENAMAVRAFEIANTFHTAVVLALRETVREVEHDGKE